MQLRNRPRPHHGERGSILIVCLVLAGVGTIGAAAFYSLVHAKSQESQERETAMTRRNATENSRELSQDEAMYRAAATNGDATSESSITLSGNWGTFAMADNSATGSAPLAYTGGFRYHKTGATPVQAFSRDLLGSVQAGGIKEALQFQAKSIHPALAGDLLLVEPQLVAGAPAISFTGNFDIEGRAVFWDSNYANTTASLRADRVILANHSLPKLGLLNTSGEAILPDNTPLPPVTTGFVNGAPRFDGASEIVSNATSSTNNYAGYVANNAGTILSGDTSSVSTLAPDTYLAGPNDTTLLAQIILLPTGLLGNILGSLTDLYPLSSQVLTALIGQTTTVDEAAVLTTILVNSSPLPRDILTQVVNGSAPFSADQRLTILRANPVTMAVDFEGMAYLNLESPALGHVHINNDIERLVLHGQDDATSLATAQALPTLVISVDCGSTGTRFLSELNFEGENGRPMIMALRKRGDNTAVSAGFTGSAFPEWRGIFELDNVELQFDATAVSAATLVGGIRTSRSIGVSGGTITLQKETGSTALANLQPVAARYAWVESFPSTP